jgi:hypothetical protein
LIHNLLAVAGSLTISQYQREPFACQRNFIVSKQIEERRLHWD